MEPQTSNSRQIVPCLRYRDAEKAIDWLREAFGFTAQMIHKTDDGLIAHAQLLRGNAMVMIASCEFQSAFSPLTCHPDETGGRGTQSSYVIVNDPEAHYKRAQEAGAKILIPLKEEDYGGAVYTCADLEGHVWSFGSYDPFQEDLYL